MHGTIVALACVVANVAFAPASAPSPMPAVTVSSSDESICEHRYGPRRTSGFARCNQLAAVQAASSCAPHYGYRGHRRVDLPAQVCLPLFD